MKLIHFSKEPLISVYSRPHQPHGCGAFKTPGLWVSDEDSGYGWRQWCVDNDFSEVASNFPLIHQTEIILADDVNILRIDSIEGIDRFTSNFVKQADRRIEVDVDWEAVRALYQGVIISPYQWNRRLDVMWYYGWDCASGVIWDAAAIKELIPIMETTE